MTSARGVDCGIFGFIVVKKRNHITENGALMLVRRCLRRRRPEGAYAAPKGPTLPRRGLCCQGIVKENSSSQIKTAQKFRCACLVKPFGLALRAGPSGAVTITLAKFHQSVPLGSVLRRGGVVGYSCRRRDTEWRAVPLNDSLV